MRIPNRHVLVGQVLGGLFVQTGGQVGVRSGGDALAVEDVSLQQREREERERREEEERKGGESQEEGFGSSAGSANNSTSSTNTRYKCYAPPERFVSAWVGGSILSSLSSFQELWVTREQYEEKGSFRACQSIL